jgi:hypothetical protein
MPKSVIIILISIHAFTSLSYAQNPIYTHTLYTPSTNNSQ